MSELYDYAYDDQGNVILIRYAPSPKQSCRHRSINPVSSAELPLIRRRAVEEAERERQKVLARAEEKKQDEERAAQFNSPISPQRRRLQLDDQSED
jgi:hypothetical protein